MNPTHFLAVVPGLFDGSCCFGGEESAGASFLRHDRAVWTTDTAGPIPYTGTRDNPTPRGWYEDLSDAERGIAAKSSDLATVS